VETESRFVNCDTARRKGRQRLRRATVAQGSRKYGAIVFNDEGYREIVASHRQAFVLVCSSDHSRVDRTTVGEASDRKQKVDLTAR
jgi:hypothetical protein